MSSAEKEAVSEIGIMSSGILSGTYALVTGGTRGIGLACASSLLGIVERVVIVGKEEASVVKAKAFLDAPGRVCGWAHDLSSDSGVDALKERLGADGFPSIVVHALGGTLGIKREDPWGCWQKVNWLNLMAPIEINRFLLDEEGGVRPSRILHISSSAVEHGEASLPYVCSKGALNAYVKSEGKRLAPRGIALAAIMPAAVCGLGNVWELVKESNEKRWAQTLEGQALGRYQTPEEIASFALWFCGSSGIIFSGQCLTADPRV